MSEVTQGRFRALLSSVLFFVQNIYENWVVLLNSCNKYHDLVSIVICVQNIYTGLFISPSGISKIDCATTKTGTAERSISIDRESLQVFVQPYSCSICAHLVTWGLLTNASRTRLTVSADGPGRPLRFAAHRQPLCWNFMYHSQIVLPVGGSVWYMIRNLRCTVTIDSVLANSKIQNAVNAIFRHNYPLAVEPASTPRPLVPKKKKLGEILFPLICSFLPCLSLLLRSRVRKSRRDL